MDDKDDKIEKIGKVSGKKNVSESSAVDEIYTQETPTNIEVNKDHFEGLMMQEKAKPQVAGVESVQKKAKPSLMDEVTTFNQKVDSASKANPKNIVLQSKELIAQLEELKTKLSTPNLELKSSVQTLLKNKLSHIDESLKIALNKAGVEYVAPAPQKNLATPIEHFLGYITDAQSQLEGLGGEIQKLTLANGTMSPASMMAIQVKVGYVQQEVELFTSLLNQMLQGIKTVFNVQV